MNDSGHLRGSGSLRAYSPRLVALMRAHRRLVVALAALSVFLVLLARILAGDIMALDRAAYALIVENLRAGWLTPIMEGFSALATPVVLVTLLLVIAAFAPGARPGWCCALNLALSTVVNLVLKALVARPRPEGFRLAQASGFSFPSGHSMAAMAFFGLIIWFVWRYERNPRMRAGLTAAFSFIILAFTWACTTPPTWWAGSAPRSSGSRSTPAWPSRCSWMTTARRRIFRRAAGRADRRRAPRASARFRPWP